MANPHCDDDRLARLEFALAAARSVSADLSLRIDSGEPCPLCEGWRGHAVHCSFPALVEAIREAGPAPESDGIGHNDRPLVGRVGEVPNVR